MKLAIITDSTCDLNAEELKRLEVTRVPLYVHFGGKTRKDWIEIGPKDIVEGVKAGMAMPSTSQPSPEDFAQVYKAAVAAGAKDILCVVISSELSGTYQSAMMAKEGAAVPVTVYDSRAAGPGLGQMVTKAAQLRAQGASVGEIIKGLERIRATHALRFTPASLEFLKKNGRIGGAQALLGTLLNVKPILKLVDGKVQPAGKARGAKKALKELIDQVAAHCQAHPGTPVIDFVHVQDPPAAEQLRQELKGTGLKFRDNGTREIGAVIASHVGPGTYGVYLYVEE
ncbi:MAG: DegV family protein [Truepera sp.]|nr:DegV family protein [Truepera sp.]